MIDRQSGFISFGSMTLLVGGLALAGALLYGMNSGYELPIWPAIAVALVNLIGAGRLIYEVRTRKQQQGRPAAPPSAD
ncbi:MAG: hypothetical protein Q8M20_06245 [Rhodocyclaceae bacterium]|nr:hypothetical protein [Rhodocyclaceae bacterium]MDZ4214499.1 hypothetical protein [Rhodocyclaceae bacterium]